MVKVYIEERNVISNGNVSNEVCSVNLTIEQDSYLARFVLKNNCILELSSSLTHGTPHLFVYGLTLNRPRNAMDLCKLFNNSKYLDRLDTSYVWQGIRTKKALRQMGVNKDILDFLKKFNKMNIIIS